jgi:tryptophan-rich sensory protein
MEDAITAAIVIAIYMLPGIIAAQRKHQSRVAIGFLTFFLGWTVIGWIVALVWAVTKVEKNEKIIYVVKDRDDDSSRA